MDGFTQEDIARIWRRVNGGACTPHQFFPLADGGQHKKQGKDVFSPCLCVSQRQRAGSELPLLPAVILLGALLLGGCCGC